MLLYISNYIYNLFLSKYISNLIFLIGMIIFSSKINLFVWKKWQYLQIFPYLLFLSNLHPPKEFSIKSYCTESSILVLVSLSWSFWVPTLIYLHVYIFYSFFKFWLHRVIFQPPLAGYIFSLFFSKIGFRVLV